MSFASVWCGWRAKIHDILEVGDNRHIKRVAKERERENEKVRRVARTARAKSAAKKETEAR
jgi:hypothetical protein